MAETTKTNIEARDRNDRLAGFGERLDLLLVWLDPAAGLGGNRLNGASGTRPCWTCRFFNRVRFTVLHDTLFSSLGTSPFIVLVRGVGFEPTKAFATGS